MDERPPLGVRLLLGRGPEPHWSTMTAEQLAALSAAEHRKRSSPLLRVITGFPTRGATIQGREIPPADRPTPRSAADHRRRSSPLRRVITGFPPRGATIQWREITLPDRTIRVRVH